MIVAVKNRSGRRTGTRGGFAAAYAYITRAGEAEHVAYSAALDPQRDVPAQMAATAASSLRALRTTPAYHVVLSWDRPIESREVVLAAQRATKRLGVSEHQWVTAVHRDTAHVHAHLLVNRVHPATHRAWKPWRDYRTLQAFAREETAYEAAAGLTNSSPRRPAPRRSAAGNFEAWHGQLSMESWARGDLAVSLDRVLERSDANWDAVHRAAARHGVTLERQPTGVVLVDRSVSRGTAISGSLVGLSARRLERCLGAYRPPSESVEISRVDGYGARRQRYDLPSPAVCDPVVAPLYRAFVAEQAAWREKAGHVREQRHAVRRVWKERERDERADEARARAILRTMRGDRGRAFRVALRETCAAERVERGNRRRTELAVLVEERPQPLFRAWLKKRVLAGDVTAGVVGVFLRNQAISTVEIAQIDRSIARGGSMQDPGVTRLVDRYAQARAAGADSVAPASEELFKDGLAQLAEHGRTAQWMDGASARIERFTGEDVSGLEMAAAAIVMRDVLSAEHLARLYEPMESVVPFTSLFQDLDREQAVTGLGRELNVERGAVTFALFDEGGAILLAPIDAIADDVPRLCEPSVDVDALHRMAENLMHGDTDGTRFPGGFVDLSAEARVIAEPAHGTISAATPGAPAEDEGFAAAAEAEVELQEIADRYRAYIESTGKTVYVDQESLFASRNADIGTRHRSLDSRNRTAAKIVRRLSADAALKSAFEAERQTIARVTGMAPPLELARWLETTHYSKELQERFLRACTIKPEAFEIGFAPMRATVPSALALEASVQEDGSGRTVIAWKRQHGFVEDKDQLHVVDARETESAKLALMVAARKYEHGMTLNGTDVFITRMLEAAVECHVEKLIVNPELQERIAQLVAERPSAEQRELEREDSRQREKIDEASRTMEPQAFRDFVDETITQTLRAQLRGSYGRDVVTSVHIDGSATATLRGVYMFPRHQYALVERNGDLSLVEIEPRLARQLDASVGDGVEVRLSRGFDGRVQLEPVAADHSVSHGR